MKKQLFKISLLLSAIFFWQSTNAQYCEGGPSSTTDSNIESVTLTGDNSTEIDYTGCPGVPGVEDQTAQVVELEAGVSYTMDVQFGTCGGNFNGAGEAWIDYDQDEAFSAGESIGQSSGTPGTAPWDAPVSFSFTVPMTAAAGQTRIRVMQQESGSNPLDPCTNFTWGSVVDFTADITAAATTCPFPTNLDATALSQQDVDLTWTAGDSETTWNVEWGAPGFSPGTGTELGDEVVTGTPATSITGLNPDTDYDFYVQADCGGGDESFWTGPASVFTGYCSPEYTSTTDYITLFETTNANENVLYTATTHPGLPGYLDFSANDTVKVEENENFDIVSEFSPANHTLLIWVDWNNDLIFDASEQVFADQNNGPNSGNIQIPGTVAPGEYRMRIRTRWGTMLGLDPCETTNWGVAIDYTLEVLPEPTCPRPSDLMASNVLPNSLDLEWTPGSNETEWEIEYDTTGFTPGNGNFVITSNNPYEVTGLDVNTEYDFYVRGICEPGDTSDWRGPTTVKTPCQVFPTPFEENFDGPSWVSGTGGSNANSEIDPCWDRVPNTSSDFFWGPREGTTTSSFSTGPSSDVSGNGNYIFTEATNGSAGDTAVFDTPMIDLSMINDPYFIFNYHMHGDDVDSLNVQISKDGGNTFDPLTTIVGEQQFDNSDDWIDITLSLANYANDTVVIRFWNIKTGFSDDIAIDELSILSCIPNGGEDNTIDVCRLDETVDLSQQITINQGGGKWVYPANQSLIVNDVEFNISTLPSGAHEVYYIVPGACEDDTTTLTIDLFPPSSAGQNGTIEVCQNEPVNLFDGLNGNVDLGGVWYDPSGDAIQGSQPKAPGVVGEFNYDYIVDNGVCPADTQFVEVQVGDCDWLSIDELDMQNIEVYPNPASELLNINNGSEMENLRVEMFDMNGRLVLTDNEALANTSKASISIAHLEKGVYTLKVKNVDGEKTFKIIKQ